MCIKAGAIQAGSILTENKNFEEHLYKYELFRYMFSWYLQFSDQLQSFCPEWTVVTQTNVNTLVWRFTLDLVTDIFDKIFLTQRSLIGFVGVLITA